jgi:hypothetical protein
LLPLVGQGPLKVGDAVAAPALVGPNFPSSGRFRPQRVSGQWISEDGVSGLHKLAVAECFFRIESLPLGHFLENHSRESRACRSIQKRRPQKNKNNDGLMIKQSRSRPTISGEPAVSCGQIFEQPVKLGPAQRQAES